MELNKQIRMDGRDQYYKILRDKFGIHQGVIRGIQKVRTTLQQKQTVKINDQLSAIVKQLDTIPVFTPIEEIYRQLRIIHVDLVQKLNLSGFPTEDERKKKQSKEKDGLDRFLTKVSV